MCFYQHHQSSHRKFNLVCWQTLLCTRSPPNFIRFYSIWENHCLHIFPVVYRAASTRSQDAESVYKKQIFFEVFMAVCVKLEIDIISTRETFDHHFQTCLTLIMTNTLPSTNTSELSALVFLSINNTMFTWRSSNKNRTPKKVLCFID